MSTFKSRLAARLRRISARQAVMERGDFLKAVSKAIRSAKSELYGLVSELVVEELLPKDKPKRELVKITNDRVTYVLDYARADEDLEDFTKFFGTNNFSMFGQIGTSKRRHDNAKLHVFISGQKGLDVLRFEIVYDISSAEEVPWITVQKELGKLGLLKIFQKL